MQRLVVLSLMAGCAAPADDAREARVLDALAEDNYVSARREPEVVRMKLRKMQRGPYEWLRGTVLLYWRDLMEPGGERSSTQFGDARSSRVLVVGDAHLENVGTFRAPDGTMFMDWNDFDATGYGPFTFDVRRLATAFGVVIELGAPGDAALASEVSRIVAMRYAETVAQVTAGVRFAAIGEGAHELFDDEISRARERGEKRSAVDELAPVNAMGVRELAFGDLEEVEADGVLEDRVVAVSDEEAASLDRAIDVWRPVEPTAGAIKLRARRIGSGVASYAVLRYQVVLEGPTASVDDDIMLELKETRDGMIARGVPMLEVAEWANPAVRAVDTQIRLHARGDGDVRLGAARVGGIAFKIRDREAFQRGMDAGDVEDLVTDDPAQLRSLAALYGELLGRAHAQALTAERVPGHTVIAPLLAGREVAFADEIATHAAVDTAQVIADYERMKDVDLGAQIIPVLR